jgi:hypothetical protein
VFSDQDASRKGREREEEINKRKRMAEVTPPANLYAVNINVQKNMEAEIKKSEIKTVEIMPQRQEIHKISSPREM